MGHAAPGVTYTRRGLGVTTVLGRILEAFWTYLGLGSILDSDLDVHSSLASSTPSNPPWNANANTNTDLAFEREHALTTRTRTQANANSDSNSNSNLSLDANAHTDSPWNAPYQLRITSNATSNLALTRTHTNLGPSDAKKSKHHPSLLTVDEVPLTTYKIESSQSNWPSSNTYTHAQFALARCRQTYAYASRFHMQGLVDLDSLL